ncbi:MAG: hypothetical protein JSS93_03745 [Bacteroidetes bacterium]|nr:hypothetical protein [Bacteroidota bacterium]
MKTKLLGIIGIAALVVLSFAFAPRTSAKAAKKEVVKEKENTNTNEPMGGLLSEDK